MRLALVVDGTEIAPMGVEGDVWQFAIPMPVHHIRLRSGAARPKDIESSGDARLLGVALRALRWRKEDAVLEVPIDAPHFIDGFHHVEVDGSGNYLFRWTTGDAALPPATFPPWTGDVRLQLSLRGWAGSALPPPQSRGAAVLGACQSLGMDCEFGLAQRACGVEPPLTLMRWSGASPDRLLAGLKCRFDGLGNAESTTAVWDGCGYVFRTPFVTLHSGTLIERDEAGVDELLHAGRATLRLLRRRLLADVEAGRVLFVCKCKLPDIPVAYMRRLHDALGAIGPAPLLCVSRTPPGRRGGDVDVLADGLQLGYVDAFTIPSGPYEQWVEVCANAMAAYPHMIGHAGR